MLAQNTRGKKTEYSRYEDVESDLPVLPNRVHGRFARTVRGRGHFDSGFRMGQETMIYLEDDAGGSDLLI